MKKPILAMLLSVSLLALAGCGDSFEKVENDKADLKTEFVNVLKGVTDEASANAAIAKIEALVVRAEELKKREEALGEPTEEDFKRAVEKLAAGGMKVAPDPTNEYIRLQQKRELITIIKPAVTKFQQTGI